VKQAPAPAKEVLPAAVAHALHEVEPAVPAKVPAAH